METQHITLCTYKSPNGGFVQFISFLGQDIYKYIWGVFTDVQKGQRHTYRYSTIISSAWKGPSSGGSQLALDCVVDIDVRPGCPEIILKVWSVLNM